MRKITTLGIMLLFLGMTISSTGFNLEKQSTVDIITVDDEGDGDYTSIKQALNNANPGDTIEVYSGMYYERGIIVEKEGITFQGIPYELGGGNDSGKPFVNGEGMNDVFHFKARNATLDGFHIENDGNPTSQNLLIIGGSDGCTISNNDLFHSTSTIIWVEDSNNNAILNNIVADSYSSGIGFYMTSSNNLISNNTIYYVEDGIKLWSSNQNTVIGNKVSKCSRYGIDVASNGNHIEGNSIESNYIGIHMYGGINNQIIKNNLISNTVNVHNTFSIPGLIITIVSNRFDGNYYDDWKGIGPKLLWGWLWLLPILVFDIDWHPASEPYDIEV